jgi:ABC-type transport system involved in cytochrome c biogenesis ATPase subunit
VGLRRSGLVLLDGFSLRFPDPGTYLLCGPAASGKTLLGRMLAGRLRPDRGNVLLDGSLVYRPRRFTDAVRSLLRPVPVPGPLFYAEAGPPLDGSENLHEFIDVELWRAGAPTTTLLPYWEVLERAIPQARRRTLDGLALSELALAQLALGAAIPARVVVLDGQLAALDQVHFAAAQQLLALNQSGDRFVVLTAPTAVGELGRTVRVDLAGGMPVQAVERGKTEVTPSAGP